MNLGQQYKKGTPVIPPDGRYTVSMMIRGVSHVVLEKRIKDGRGSNYAPVFCLRHFKLPFMDFEIVFRNSIVHFVYDNGILVDNLRKIDSNTWLGEIFINTKFVDWFWLRRK